MSSRRGWPTTGRGFSPDGRGNALECPVLADRPGGSRGLRSRRQAVDQPADRAVLTGEPQLLIVSDTLPPDKNGVALIASRTSVELCAYGKVGVLGPTRWRAPAGVDYFPVPRLPIGSEDFRF